MQYLNQPLVLQGMRLNNRLVMPPMATAKSTAEGAVTQALCEYYRARAEGGFLGLIITEHSYVSAQGKASAGQLSAADDAVEGLRELVAAARRDGARVMAQINHAGAAADPAVTGCEAVAPSAAARPQARADLPLPRALTKGEIADIAAQFAMTGATVSHHLAVLRQAGLIDQDKRGKFIYYELNMTVLDEITGWIAGLRGGDAT